MTKKSPENEKRQQGSRVHKCDLCGKEFTSGKALGGHKSFHSSNNLLQHQIKMKMGILKKITHRCDLCNKVFPSIKALNGHMKRHCQIGLKKDDFDDQDQFHPIDLSDYLPPRKYKTNKRSMKYIFNFEAHAARILLDISRSRESVVNLDLSIRNVDDYEKFKQQGMLLSSGNQPSSNHIEEENNNNEGDETNEESDHELGSNVSLDFDLNELPTDDVGDKTAN